MVHRTEVMLWRQRFASLFAFALAATLMIFAWVDGDDINGTGICSDAGLPGGTDTNTWEPFGFLGAIGTVATVIELVVLIFYATAGGWTTRHNAVWITLMAVGNVARITLASFLVRYVYSATSLCLDSWVVKAPMTLAILYFSIAASDIFRFIMEMAAPSAKLLTKKAWSIFIDCWAIAGIGLTLIIVGATHDGGSCVGPTDSNWGSAVTWLITTGSIWLGVYLVTSVLSILLVFCDKGEHIEHPWYKWTFGIIGALVWLLAMILAIAGMLSMSAPACVGYPIEHVTVPGAATVFVFSALILIQVLISFTGEEYNMMRGAGSHGGRRGGGYMSMGMEREPRGAGYMSTSKEKRGGGRRPQYKFGDDNP